LELILENLLPEDAISTEVEMLLVLDWLTENVWTLLETVMPFPVRSAIVTAALAPAAQSSAAAMLYVVAPIDEVPFLLSRLLRPV